MKSNIKNILIAGLGFALIAETIYLVKPEWLRVNKEAAAANVSSALNSNAETRQRPALPASGTLPFSADSAQLCTDAYINHPGTLRTLVNGNLQTLRGFSVNLANMSSMMSLNPDHLYMQLAVKPGDIGKSQSEQRFTLIVSGVKDDFLIKGANGQVMYYEYIMACPNNCPK